MAEKEGFEPSIPFWGIHDFQSCALGQLRDFSKCAVRSSPLIILHLRPFVKYYFSNFNKKLNKVEGYKIVDIVLESGYNIMALQMLV